MKIHILICVLSILFLEIIIFSNLFEKLKKNFSFFKEIFLIFKSNIISDSEKQKNILNICKKTLINLSKVFAILFFLLIILIITYKLYSPLINYLFTFVGTAEVIFISIIYLYLRKKI